LGRSGRSPPGANERSPRPPRRPRRARRSRPSLSPGAAETDGDDELANAGIAGREPIVDGAAGASGSRPSRDSTAVGAEAGAVDPGRDRWSAASDASPEGAPAIAGAPSPGAPIMPIGPSSPSVRTGAGRPLPYFFQSALSRLRA